MAYVTVDWLVDKREKCQIDPRVGMLVRLLDFSLVEYSAERRVEMMDLDEVVQMESQLGILPAVKLVRQRAEMLGSKVVDE